MQLSLAATLLACTAVQAFSDSSPFVLFSTARLQTSSNDAQLQTSSQVIASAKEILSTCPTQRYILVSQPNVHAADIRDGDRCRMPNLCRAIRSETTQGQFSVAEVIGQVSAKVLTDHITASCAEKHQTADVSRVELAHLPGLKETKKRAEVLSDNDHELGQLLETLDGEYTIILFSDPNEFQAYEPEFTDPVHMDLKRGSEAPVMKYRRKANETDHRALFEKYQFFTPGVFMSLITLIVILSILYVGLRALASLEVSYGAFDKENGPSAQKK